VSKINPQDLAVSRHSSSSGKPGVFDRRHKVTECRIKVKHRPTGIEVEGDVPPGHYAKKEMQKLRDELEARLKAELLLKVAQRLCWPSQMALAK
jgi:hypothetical protein